MYLIYLPNSQEYTCFFLISYVARLKKNLILISDILIFRASGVCKHVGGLLWYIEREVRLGNNKTCTSKKQQWSVPSQKNVRLHKATTLQNINIKKPAPSKIIGRQTATNKSAIKKTVRSLSETDVDSLAEITNGKCGLVILKRQRTNNLMNIGSISSEVDVEASETITMPRTIREICKELSLCNLDEFLKAIKINVDQQQELVQKTKSQSSCTIWFEYRNDRITASNFKAAVSKINNKNEVINPSKSRTILSKVCGYYPKCKSKATDWGISNEPAARNIYIKSKKMKHQNFKVEETGFFISINYPFIGVL